MIIKKDPETLPEEVVDFVDVYEDINSPQYWIAISDEDLKTTLLVLDGHSTILIYTQDEEELQWEAIHELGQYAYQPEKTGDGLVVFPHTFYLEFKIRLTDKELDVNANFDGTGIRAITMPFNDVEIIDFIDQLTDRVSDIFSTGLKKHDDKLDIKEGEELNIPDNILNETIGFKLGLIGVNLQKINISKVTPIELPEEDIQEEIFEVPETVEEEEVADEVESVAAKEETVQEEMAEQDKGKVPPPRKPSGPPMPKSDKSQPMAPAPSPGSGPPSPKKTTGGPPKPGKPAPKPSIGSGSEGAVEIDAGTKTPASIPAPGGGGPPSPTTDKSKRSRKRSAPAAERSVPVPESSGADMDDLFADVDEEMGKMKETPVSEGANLYARGMDTSSSGSQVLKNTHVTWASRMIPNRAYGLSVRLTTEEVKARKSVTNQKTGEVISEKVDEVSVDTSSDLIIRPEFPGCLVVPPQRVVDSNDDDITAEFHVTPLALGVLESKIIFEQDGKEIHSVALETKVIKHRIARLSAGLGAITGSLPAVFAFMFDQSPGQFMNERMQDIAILNGLGYIVPLIFSGLFFAIAGGIYWVQKPTTDNKSVAFPK